MRVFFVLGLTAGVACSTAISTAGATEFTKAEIQDFADEAGLDPSVLHLQGDVEYGAYLSGECTTCHQTSGDFDGIPAIVQWDQVLFKLAMYEYKAKMRDHPVMQMIAGQLDDEGIAALAAYFAQLEQE